MVVIDCQRVDKQYGFVKALSDMSFTIDEELIGRNGAGKTTLLKILAGFIAPTDGRVQVLAKEPFNNLFVSAHSILVDDQMQIPDQFSLQDTIEEAARFYQNFDVRLAFRLLDYFSLPRKAKHKNLSKGQKSTFNAIFGMFDEPTTGMDAAVRKDFYRALLKDYLSHPRTIIISSHYLNEIEDLLEDVLLMNHGEKELHESIDTLKEYAIGVTGHVSTINDFVEKNNVIHRRDVNYDEMYVVVKRTSDALEFAEKFNLTVEAVTPSDLCLYLTEKSKEGIDDVFEER